MDTHPTDQRILQAIYDRYRSDFAAFPEDGLKRKTKVLVPIDIPALASALGMDADLLFGRLYYYLEEKYGVSGTDGVRKSLFSLGVGGDRHCVNFPMLASVLAHLRHETDNHRWPLWVSIASLLVATGALLVSVFSLCAV